MMGEESQSIPLITTLTNPFGVPYTTLGCTFCFGVQCPRFSPIGQCQPELTANTWFVVADAIGKASLVSQVSKVARFWQCYGRISES